MDEISRRHKEAWEYDAYAFWVAHIGRPEDLAGKIAADPVRALRRFAGYFDRFEGVRVADICGSCGKKAVPMALLGAEVTVFDISEENRRYAAELAKAAGVPLGYEVCDVLDIDLTRYGASFDAVFMEGGVLHYFHDLGAFMGIMHALLKPGGKMICSDFHPFCKITDALGLGTPAMGYFNTEVYEGEMAHARFYDPETRRRMPRCSYRKYTVGEIINAVIDSGFTLKRFDEHPAWENADLPGEFTAVAVRDP